MMPTHPRRASARALSFMVFCLLGVIFISGCSSLNTSPPDVSLVDIEFGEVTLFETSLLVTTRLRNDSNQPLNITGMVQELSLNGTRLGKAMSRENLRLKPLESKRVVSTLELSHLNLALNLSDLINSPKLNYSLQSEFFLEGLFGRTIRSSKDGVLISEKPVRANSLKEAQQFRSVSAQ